MTYHQYPPAPMTKLKYDKYQQSQTTTSSITQHHYRQTDLDSYTKNKPP